MRSLLDHHGHILAAGGRDGTIRMWDVTSYAQPRPLGRPVPTGIGSIWSVAFQPGRAHHGCQRRQRANTAMGYFRPRTPPAAREIPECRDRASVVSGIQPDGAYAGQRRLRRHGPAMGCHAARASSTTLGPPLAINVSDPNSISFTSNGKFLAYGGWGTQPNRENGVVEQWYVANPSRPKLIQDLPGGTDLARAVAFSPDMHILISGNYDGTVEYWVKQPAPWVQPLTPQIGGIYAAAPPVPVKVKTSVAPVPEGLIAVSEYDFDSLTCGPDLRYVSRPVFKLICRAIADQDRHTPRIDHTTTSAATYRDRTKPGHGPQEIDPGEVADVIHDRSGAAATGGVLSPMEQLAAARRRPGCLDKSRYDTRNTQFCAAPSRDPGSQLVEHNGGSCLIGSGIGRRHAAGRRDSPSRQHAGPPRARLAPMALS